MPPAATGPLSENFPLFIFLCPFPRKLVEPFAVCFLQLTVALFLMARTVEKKILQVKDVEGLNQLFVMTNDFFCKTTHE